MPAATANVYYDGLTAVFLGPRNPTQLLEHGLSLGQNHGEKRALWHNGEATCNPQLLVGKDGGPTASWLLCRLAHRAASAPASSREPAVL